MGCHHAFLVHLQVINRKGYQHTRTLSRRSERGYISKGLVESLMSLFEVPKGLTDIHIVFDGTACGLNDVLWAPCFHP
jgi:hypothetical protein